MSYRDFFRRTILVSVLVVALFGLWYLRQTLLLGFAALVLSVAMSIPANFLQTRLHWPRRLALLVAILTALLILILVILVVVPNIVRETASLFTQVPRALTNAATYYQTLRESNERLLELLPALEFETFVGNSQEMMNNAVAVLNAGIPIVLQGFGILASSFANLAIILFISIFFLIDPSSYIKASLFLTPRLYHQRALAIWNELYYTLRSWLSALFISISITTFLVWLILGVFLGMPNVMSVAVFAGFATLIPNVGVFLPLIPITIFTLANDPSSLLVIVVAYLLIQLVESNILTPSIVKAELNIPAGGMLLFQVISGILMGALGVLLAVPLLAVIITLVREVYSYDMLGLRTWQVGLAQTPYGWSMTESQVEDEANMAAQARVNRGIANRIAEFVRRRFENKHEQTDVPS